jgi:lysophospholipase L1-like esterase
MGNIKRVSLLRTHWVLPTLLAMAMVVGVTGGCSSSPTAPTPAPTPTPTPTPTPVPDPDPPSLTCPATVTASTTATTGIAVTFATPAVTAGKEPVTVACTPASGSTFALGTTAVSCTATDSLNRTGSCSFNVVVSRTPQLTVTKFLAFGDSITQGEVSFPIAGISPQGFQNVLLRIVPSASYPSVLQGLMTARYTAQSSSITVRNEGLAGEKALGESTQSRFAQAVSSFRPDVVLIMHGYNDIENPGVLTATAGAIAQMAQEARNRGARIFIANLAPPRTTGSNARPLSSVTGFNDRLLPVIRGEGATLVDVYSALSPAVNTYIGIDGLHPNEAGYRKIAETFLATIQASLEVR